MTMAIRLKTDRLTVIHLFLNLKENGHQYACPQQALHYKIRRVHFSNTRFKHTQAVKMVRLGRQTVSNTGSSQSRRGQVTMK